MLFIYLSLFGTLFTSFFWLPLNREIGLIVYFFSRIYRYSISIEAIYPSDNSNRTNWMSDSDLYDMIDQ